MLVLSLESSAKSASVAISREGELISQYSQNSGLTHSRTLLPMVEDILKNNELTMADVDLIAVANGPGSFTGVRIGVSVAKGLAWAKDKPALGVSTLEAMAWHGLAAPEGAIICPVMDARRNQVYNALFKIVSDKPERLCEDRAISLENLAEEIKNMKEIVFLVGDGAKLCYNYLKKFELPVVLAPEPMLFQSAWGVAKASMNKTPGTSGDLLPQYLRLSQAERERQERMKTNV